MQECVEAATKMCAAAGDSASLLRWVFELAIIALGLWKTRQKVLELAAAHHETSAKVERVATAAAENRAKVEHVHEVVRALSTPPPGAPSASSPALVPVVIPAQPAPPTDLLTAQVDGQSDRETKP